jgi:hypothetical protein
VTISVDYITGDTLGHNVGKIQMHRIFRLLVNSTKVVDSTKAVVSTRDLATIHRITVVLATTMVLTSRHINHISHRAINNTLPGPQMVIYNPKNPILVQSQ